MSRCITYVAWLVLTAGAGSREETTGAVFHARGSHSCSQVRWLLCHFCVCSCLLCGLSVCSSVHMSVHLSKRMCEKIRVCFVHVNLRHLTVCNQILKRHFKLHTKGIHICSIQNYSKLLFFCFHLCFEVCLLFISCCFVL